MKISKPTDLKSVFEGQTIHSKDELFEIIQPLLQIVTV